MKKRLFFAAILAAVLLAALYFAMPKQLPQVLGNVGDVTLFCEGYEGDCVDMGGLFAATVDADGFVSAVLRATGVKGVCVKYEGGVGDALAIAAELRLRNSFTDDCGVFSLCGYSPLICGGTRVGGKLVNVQIAVGGGFVYVGTPVILGSF